MTPTSINPTGESVLGSLYSLRDNPEAPIETPKPAETPAVETTPAVAKPIETPQASVETQLEPTEEDHTPLPPKVQARIDKEIAKQVSLRKELEAKVKAAEPVKQVTETVKSGTELEKPKRPPVPRYGQGTGNENETWEQFQSREAKYDTDVDKYDSDLSDYIMKVTESETQRRFTQKQAKEAHEAVIAQATKDHGEDFLALTQQVADHSPIEFQHALLAIDDWPTLAVYLARNQDKLTQVVEKFKTNQISAIETLGRMRAGLKGSNPKPAETQDKALPAPLKPVAGSGTVISSVDLNKMAEEKPGALQSKLREMFPERVYR